MSEKIQFQTNLPVELALQYLEGKPVDSQFGGVQHLFSTTDNRVFFVSEMVGNIIADQLKKLGVQKGEAIEICKAEVTQGRGRKGIQWIVKKVGSPVGEQPDGTFAVPAAQACFEDAWDREAAGAAFGTDEDVDLLKRQAAMLTRKYLDEVAPEIEPAALELPVQGVIGGVAVRGFVDLLDTGGRIMDLKTAVRKPTGVSADYSFQLATYAKLCPGANGKARVDHLVATKSPQVITQEYTVSPPDLKMTEKLYPLVREAMREGIYLPNRSSNLCSYRHCSFAAVCEADFGGRVKGADEQLA